MYQILSTFSYIVPGYSFGVHRKDERLGRTWSNVILNLGTPGFVIQLF